MSPFDDKWSKKKPARTGEKPAQVPLAVPPPTSATPSVPPVDASQAALPPDDELERLTRPAEGPADPLAAVALTADDLAPQPEPSPPAPEPELPPAPPGPRAPRVRVLVAGNVMIGACRHGFESGAILDANHYTDRDFKRLLGALQTESVKE
jgi:hypothetical protein